MSALPPKGDIAECNRQKSARLFDHLGDAQTHG
jgi:hypothetical protein